MLQKCSCHTSEMYSSDQNQQNSLHKHGCRNHSFRRYEIILALRYYIRSVIYIVLYLSAHTSACLLINKHTH